MLKPLIQNPLPITMRGEKPVYTVFYGCPVCGRKIVRDISREHALRLSPETIPEHVKGMKYYLCMADSETIHVFTREI